MMQVQPAPGADRNRGLHERPQPEQIHELKLPRVDVHIVESGACGLLERLREKRGVRHVDRTGNAHPTTPNLRHLSQITATFGLTEPRRVRPFLIGLPFVCRGALAKPRHIR